ncbi:glycerol dehydrogenase [Paenibacillus sophorae]|uniref:Glycerol dehydrogenase n=1 Tax=Paenibacillus sophorae TaxID=1333845 RepID=A0A1H8MAF4_9BACL|nr:iron-containing alcohol dehydrogenase family protein [Paenibacillus sophorae]QWU17729.1 iron-containing alcohol dehydrogenase family protein [Paenibacillus sophorae]SEO14126.1 glycerol dehydrogenase [Paenibacillus sophorae]
MITLKAPYVYMNESGALAKAGALVAELGQKAYLIGGDTALRRVQGPLLASLHSAGIETVTEVNQGEVSRFNIEDYAWKTSEIGPDVLIATGGGLVLDLVKAVGDRTGIPVVAVPTIAATCAAWSALSILHDDEGRADGALFLTRSPAVVIADSDVLAEAPKRYFASGIGDTLAKWYEVALNLKEGAGHPDILLSLAPAKLALDIIERFGPEAYSQAGSGKAGKAFREVTDAIVMLTGLAGTINGKAGRALVAHAIHDSFTHLPDTHDTLHGEKVGFCLIVQSILEGRSDIKELTAALRRYNLPATLAELGVHEHVDDKIRKVAESTQIIPSAEGFAFPTDSGRLTQAIWAADAAGRAALPNGTISANKIVPDRTLFPYYPY